MHRQHRPASARVLSGRAVTSLVALGVIGLAGCGSTSGGSAATSSRPPATTVSSAAAPATTAAPATSAAASSSAVSAAPSSTAASAAAPSAASGPLTATATDIAGIRTAFAVFFGPGQGSASMDHLQNGEQFQAVLDQQGQGPDASSASATVSKVTLISPDTAKLTFTISLKGQPVLPNQPGYAVKQDGIWKVSDFTFCGLMRLEMGSKAPSQCATAVGTQTPQ